ncbi:MAG: hypothetical protein ACI80V_003040 [Rhodothermales bacterium]|jgi:hypothetical protein
MKSHIVGSTKPYWDHAAHPHRRLRPSGQAANSPEAQEFLDGYTARYQELSYAAAEAEWTLNTRIVEGDTVAAWEANRANEAYAAFTSSMTGGGNTPLLTRSLRHRGYGGLARPTPIFYGRRLERRAHGGLFPTSDGVPAAGECGEDLHLA